ncbi:MAG: hypothetical protein KatS3mg008_0771 [Acidimicrobiales bacterium]|nr:MAG: hypothetical protein KatS3mg008_0771 [Acidimicrobiales bacterium]
MDVGLRLDGVLVAGVRSDDMALVGELARATTALGSEIRMLRSNEVRTVEPLLSPRARGGFLAPGEGAVDPRRLLAALASACRALGVQVIDGRAHEVVVTGSRVEGLETSEGRVVASMVVVAAGSWSPQVDVPGAPRLPVHPVFGESLRLSQEDPRMVPSHVVRGYVNGRPIYVVPRLAPRGTPSEIVVGATSSEMGFRHDPTALGVHDLLCDARTLVPALDEATFCEVSVGLRPATPDNLPLVGRAGIDGLVVACGHHRNGVLLAPLTADAVARIVCGGESTELDDLLDPARFAHGREKTSEPTGRAQTASVREV